ncbi:MAG: hypothetical protein AB7G37_02720 [Solirubrobacteraceae bacterium]
MGYEPDHPTRALPQAPRYRGQDSGDPYGDVPPPRPTGPGGGDQPTDREQLRYLEEQVQSARQTVTVVAVVAAVALAIAFWALVDGGGGDDPGTSVGGSSSGLSGRIATLEDRIDARATDGDLEKVRAELETIKTQVEDGAPADGETTAGSDGDAVDSGTLTRVQDDLDDLEDRVRRLETSSGSGGTATPAPTPDPLDDPTTTTP